MRFVWKYTAGVWWVQALCLWWVKLLFKCDVEGESRGQGESKLFTLRARRRRWWGCEMKDVLRLLRPR
jgi:hypothetical protein